MKGIVSFLKFYAKVIFAIWCISMVITLTIYGLIYISGERDWSFIDIIIYSSFGSLINGFVLATLAVLFLTLSYYWNVGKSKLRRKKQIEK